MHFGAGFFPLPLLKYMHAFSGSVRENLNDLMSVCVKAAWSTIHLLVAVETGTNFHAAFDEARKCLVLNEC